MASCNKMPQPPAARMTGILPPGARLASNRIIVRSTACFASSVTCWSVYQEISSRAAKLAKAAFRLTTSCRRYLDTHPGHWTVIGHQAAVQGSDQDALVYVGQSDGDPRSLSRRPPLLPVPQGAAAAAKYTAPINIKLTVLYLLVKIHSGH